LTHHKSIEKLDLGAAALDHVLAHRRTVLAATRAAGLAEPVVVDFSLGRRIAFAGTGQGLRIHVADFIEGVAERLPDADRLAAQPVREMTDRVILDHVAADHAGAGRKSVAHNVGDEFRPALAPQIFGHHGTVGIADQLADLLGAVGLAAMYLADAEDRVTRTRFAGGPTHLTRRM